MMMEVAYTTYVDIIEDFRTASIKTLITTLKWSAYADLKNYVYKRQDEYIYII